MVSIEHFKRAEISNSGTATSGGKSTSSRTEGLSQRLLDSCKFSAHSEVDDVERMVPQLLSGIFSPIDYFTFSRQVVVLCHDGGGGMTEDSAHRVVSRRPFERHRGALRRPVLQDRRRIQGKGRR